MPVNVVELVATSLALFAFAVLLSRAFRWLLRKVGSANCTIPHVLSYGILVLLQGAGRPDEAGAPRFGHAAALLIIPQLAAFLVDVWPDLAAKRKGGIRSLATPAPGSDSKTGWLTARVRRGAAWAVSNPGYALVALCAIALLSPVAWRASERLALTARPPSMTGSWYGPELTLSLMERDRRITGGGSLKGHPFSVSGVGTSRAADLVIQFAAETRQTAVTAMMPDRESLTLTLLGLGQDGTQSLVWRFERREKLEAEMESKQR